MIRLSGGSLDNKSELLRELLVSRSLKPQETIMVGDRKHDVIAAKSNGLISIGVTYGYGSASELTEAGVNYLCHSPTEVVSVICRSSVLERRARNGIRTASEATD